jgi:hypothetical protein
MFVKFLIQVLFGASLVLFAMIMIVKDERPDKEIYFSMLSGTVGLFLPHPTPPPAEARATPRRVQGG